MASDHLLRKEQVDRELDEELRAYQEMAAEEKVKQGLSLKGAQRAVRLERGSIDVTKEIVRTGRWESFVETCWQDLRFAARIFRKSPGLTFITVLTAALGIAANVTVFSVIDGLFLRSVSGEKSRSGSFELLRRKTMAKGSLSIPEFAYLRDRAAQDRRRADRSLFNRSSVRFCEW